MPSLKSIVWTAAIALGVYVGVQHYSALKGK